jgi:hypothetical protein
MAALAFDVGNEADATAIVLLIRPVQTVCGRQPILCDAFFVVSWSHGLPWWSRRGPADPVTQVQALAVPARSSKVRMPVLLLPPGGGLLWAWHG